jgi:hypothetical protein
MHKDTLVQVESVKDAEHAQFIGKELPVKEENSDGSVVVEAEGFPEIVVTSFVPTGKPVKEQEPEKRSEEAEGEKHPGEPESESEKKTQGSADVPAESSTPAQENKPKAEVKPVSAKPQASHNQTKKK